MKLIFLLLHLLSDDHSPFDHANKVPRLSLVSSFFVKFEKVLADVVKRSLETDTPLVPKTDLLQDVLRETPHIDAVLDLALKQLGGQVQFLVRISSCVLVEVRGEGLVMREDQLSKLLHVEVWAAVVSFSVEMDCLRLVQGDSHANLVHSHEESLNRETFLAILAPLLPNPFKV